MKGIRSHHIILVFILLISVLQISCSRQDDAREYFQSHGMSYPVDVSGVSLFAVKYAGVGEDEMYETGAREFVGDGIASIKEYFTRIGVRNIIPEAGAIAVDKPVLFRAENGEVGLMVRITAFGSGEPDNMKEPVKWAGEKSRLWKTVNFAYFNRSGLSSWSYSGLVF